MTKQVEVNEVYDRLTITRVYKENVPAGYGGTVQRVFCDADCACGNKKERLDSYNVLSGRTRSCGCLLEEARSKKKHDYQEGDTVGIFKLKKLVNEATASRFDEWEVECSCGEELTLKVATMLKRKKCTCGGKHQDKTYNGLTIRRTFVNDKKQQMSVCECICGEEKTIRTSSVVSGVTKTCGCRSDYPGKKEEKVTQ